MRAKIFFIGTILSGFFLMSCEKEVPAPSPATPSVVPGGMAAIINGTQWMDNFVVGFISTTDTSLTISGSANNMSVTININDFNSITEGDYYIPANGKVVVYINNSTRYEAESGIITFSKIDRSRKKISGAFNFNAVNILSRTDRMSITDGYFNDLVYQYNWINKPSGSS